MLLFFLEYNSDNNDDDDNDDDDDDDDDDVLHNLLFVNIWNYSEEEVRSSKIGIFIIDLKLRFHIGISW